MAPSGPGKDGDAGPGRGLGPPDVVSATGAAGLEPQRQSGLFFPSLVKL